MSRRRRAWTWALCRSSSSWQGRGKKQGPAGAGRVITVSGSQLRDGEEGREGGRRTLALRRPPTSRLRRPPFLAPPAPVLTSRTPGTVALRPLLSREICGEGEATFRRVQEEERGEGKKTNIRNRSTPDLRLNLRPVLTEHRSADADERVLPSSDLDAEVQERLRVVLAVASGEVLVLLRLLAVRSSAMRCLRRAGGGRGGGRASARALNGRGRLVVTDFGAAATAKVAVVGVVLVRGRAADFGVDLKKGEKGGR